ncbi:MAG: low molecular weight phosphotyrosine protein phosphatase [Oscillatoria sp. SIO1A7]|nr:low molecular weight phosphotyrosine protein phosphatase [Oscillatoria sp. SIO1A7]
MEPYKLLFVCLGNICRSPAAENIMNHSLARENLQNQIVCDSAGTSSYHVGSPPDVRMAAAARERGMTFTGSARQFKKSDFEDFDLILAMDRDNYRNILFLDTEDKYSHKVKMMCDFCRDRNDKEVPDPYYGGPEGFNKVIDLLLDASSGLLEYAIAQIEESKL